MEEKIKIAKEVAGKIDGVVGISSAGVDDYNRHGSFQIVAYLDLRESNKPHNEDFNMRNITQQIKKILKQTKEVSNIGINIFAPQRVYSTYTCLGTRDRYFEGYERSYIMIDFVVVNLSELVSIKEFLSSK